MIQLSNNHHSLTLKEGTRVVKKDIIAVTQTDTAGQALYPGPAFAFINYFRDPTNTNPVTNKNMNINGSVVSVVYRLAPPVGYVYYLGSLHLVIADGTVQADRYGAVVLTNGCLLQITKNSITQNAIAGESIIDIDEIISHGADVDFKISGAGPQIAFARIAIREVADRSLTLDGDLGDKIEFIVRDNLTGLDYHRMSAIGTYYIKALL